MDISAAELTGKGGNGDPVSNRDDFQPETRRRGAVVKMNLYIKRHTEPGLPRHGEAFRGSADNSAITRTPWHTVRRRFPRSRRHDFSIGYKFLTGHGIS